MNCSPPGSCLWDFPGRDTEWVAISFSRGSSWPRDWTRVSCTAGRFFTDWAAREARCPLWDHKPGRGWGWGTGRLWAETIAKEALCPEGLPSYGFSNGSKPEMPGATAISTCVFYKQAPRPHAVACHTGKGLHRWWEERTQGSDREGCARRGFLSTNWAHVVLRAPGPQRSLVLGLFVLNPGLPKVPRSLKLLHKILQHLHVMRSQEGSSPLYGLRGRWLCKGAVTQVQPLA